MLPPAPGCRGLVLAVPAAVNTRLVGPPLIPDHLSLPPGTQVAGLPAKAGTAQLPLRRGGALPLVSAAVLVPSRPHGCAFPLPKVCALGEGLRRCPGTGRLSG